MNDQVAASIVVRTDGRVVLGEETRLQSANRGLPSILCDHPGRDLTPSVPVPTGTEGPPGCYRGRRENIGALLPMTWE